MNNLLIDIGNSDIKIGTVNSGSQNVKLINRYPYIKKNFRKDFADCIKDLRIKSQFDQIGISILKDINQEFLDNYFQKNFAIKPVFINRDMKLPITIKYSEGLGNDRICNAAAAVREFKNKNILVIDFGTATTYTLISNKVLKGGMISPGIKTSLESLVNKTSLPEIKLTFPKEIINNNTGDNIKAGVMYQSLFTAERFIQEAKKIYGSLFVVATGGFAEIISAKTKLINTVDKDLVLKGINFIISQ